MTNSYRLMTLQYGLMMDVTGLTFRSVYAERCLSSRGVIACGRIHVLAGMGGIHGFPASASRRAVMTLMPCLAAVEM